MPLRIEVYDAAAGQWRHFATVTYGSSLRMVDSGADGITRQYVFQHAQTTAIYSSDAGPHAVSGAFPDIDTSKMERIGELQPQETYPLVLTTGDTPYPRKFMVKRI